jgi:ketosteroid isomerase-like protein
MRFGIMRRVVLANPFRGCEPFLTRLHTGGGKNMAGDLHRQRVLNFLDAFYSGDIEGALARCSDDIDFVAHAPVDILPHMGHRKGKAAVREMWQTVHARYSSMRYEVPVIVAEGDNVAAHIRVFFSKRSNDRVVQIDIADFYTLRGGRIARIRQFLDSFDLVQQVLERDVAADLTGGRPGKR